MSGIQGSVRALLFLQVAVSVFMAGVIWVIQVVHYPLMARVGASQFVAYEAAHVARITLVVGAPMVLEALAALALALAPPPRVPSWATWAGLGLVALIWLSTVVWQVPAHDALRGGFDVAAHRALVATNAVRTAAWTARAALALWMLARSIPPLP